MSGNNNHINEFINYYSHLSVPPEYALMIKGAWGCGKSHIVKQCIENLQNSDNPIKFLYVSLYGISSTEDIETRFFQILNPVLSSKKMVLAGRFAKGFLKGALKVDLDGDGKSDATVNGTMPDINLSDYLTDTTNCVLVFDDLERCSMELKSILGYINYFVEKDGYKVILIADEEKLKENNTDNSFEYKHIKEKLIGKTLEVEANINLVFDKFLETIISNSEVKTALENKKHRLIEHFSNSNHKNLRSIRKALLEFERLWLKLDESCRKEEKLISHLLDIFIILSMEIYSGEILPKEIKHLIGDSTVSRKMKIGKEKDLPPNKYDVIEEKYDANLYETLLTPPEWEFLFEKGHIISNDINSSLKETKYFFQENTPAWKKIWYIYDLEDFEFEELYNSVNQSYINREYILPGEIKHVSALLLSFSRKKLINKDVTIVLSECKAYLDDVFDKSVVNVDARTLEIINGFGSYANLAYADSESDEFKEFSDYLNEKIRDAEKIELKSRAGEIIQAVKYDPTKLYTLICHSNYQESPFYSRPIMQHIPADEFISLFLDINNKAKRVVAEALFHRYKHQGLNGPILIEHVWLREVIAGIEKEINGKDETISIIVIRDAKIKLMLSLEKLEESL